MTSLAFILGVVPLVWAIGAGAELRQALGTAVFFGMIGVTMFGLIFTPVFYVVVRWIAVRLRPAAGSKSLPSNPRKLTAANDNEIRLRPGAHAQGRRSAAPRRRALCRRCRAGSQLHAVVVRSPHAHARFRITDLGRVRAMPACAWC